MKIINKKLYYVDISTLDYTIDFYDKKPKTVWGQLHGPFKTFAEAKRESRKIMKSYVDEYLEVYRSILTAEVIKQEEE